MKKSKILFGALAFTLAIGAAFASKIDESSLTTYYRQNSGSCDITDCDPLNSGTACTFTVYSAKSADGTTCSSTVSNAKRP